MPAGNHLTHTRAHQCTLTQGNMVMCNLLHVAVCIMNCRVEDDLWSHLLLQHTQSSSISKTLLWPQRINRLNENSFFCPWALSPYFLTHTHTHKPTHIHTPSYYRTVNVCRSSRSNPIMRSLAGWDINPAARPEKYSVCVCVFVFVWFFSPLIDYFRSQY